MTRNFLTDFLDSLPEPFDLIIRLILCGFVMYCGIKLFRIILGDYYYYQFPSE